MRIKYKDPPISELVMAVYFSGPVSDLRSEHIGMFWRKIREEFPKSQQQMPIGGLPSQVEGEVFPMPRFWFMSEDEVYLIQVQRNALIFNWRRRDENYPHYEALKKNFYKQLSKFEEFCAEEFNMKNVLIEKCELTYINVISDQPYFQSILDTANVIPSFPIVATKSTEPKSLSGYNILYNYECEPDTTVLVSLQSRRHKKSNKDALYFELKTAGEIAEKTKESSSDWFDRAHDIIGSTFNELTNPKVQEEYWKPTEESR